MPGFVTFGAGGGSSGGGGGLGQAVAFSVGERVVDGVDQTFDGAVFYLDPSEWVGTASFIFGAVFAVNVATRDAIVELVNVGDAPGDVLATLTIDGGTEGLGYLRKEAAPLVVGVGAGELRPGSNLYAVRLSLDVGPLLASEQALLGSAYVRVI